MCYSNSHMEATLEVRRCNRCNQDKPTSAFRASKRERSGFVTICKTCMQPASKVCTGCNTLKLPSEFYKDRKTPDGFQHHCKVCRGPVQLASYMKNREKRRAAGRANYWKNRDRYLASNRAYKSANPECIEKQKLSRVRYFGINRDEYLRMSEAQGHLCAICRLPERVKIKGKLITLAIDHCHKTGAIRGLLCAACNRALGGFGANKETLARAIEYLSAPQTGLFIPTDRPKRRKPGPANWLTI